MPEQDWHEIDLDESLIEQDDRIAAERSMAERARLRMQQELSNPLYGAYHNTPANTTNYQDAPITCRNCGMRCTRPTPKTIRTSTCRACRNQIKDAETLHTLPTEPLTEGEQADMSDKKETILVNQSDPKKGILQKMRIKRVPEGISLTYSSPIMQTFFKSWFQKDTYPETINKQWRSSAIPHDHQNKAYMYMNEIPFDYQKLVYFDFGSNKLVNNGKPNLAFLQTINYYPTEQDGSPTTQDEASKQFNKDKNTSFMNPMAPIEIVMTGLFPNSILDDFMQRTKEVMYRIYSDNLMPFDKSMVISFEERETNDNQENKDSAAEIR